MHDDELLRRLGETARDEEREERERLDPRWDELAAGRLPAEEAAALRREAEETMEGRETAEAFSPLGAEFRARVVREARALLGTPAPAMTSAPEPSEHAEGAPADERAGRGEDAPVAGNGGVEPTVDAAAHRPESATRPPRRVERSPAPPRRRPRARQLWWAAAAALAAAVALVVILPAGDGAPLPAYEIRLAGEVRGERSPDPDDATERRWDEPAIFAPGNRFELVLRPERAVSGRLAVRTYRQEGGALLRWSLPVEGPHDGTVRIAGTVGAGIDLPAGESTLVVVLGRRGGLPVADEVVAQLGTGGHARTSDWLAWRQRLALPPGRGAVGP